MKSEVTQNPTAILKGKAITGSFFQIFGRFSLRAVKILKTIVIARFLFPEDVGLFVLASSLLGFAEFLLQSGLQSALIQREVITKNHLDGVWTVHFIKNVFLGILVYLLAPYAATFFEQEALVSILRTLALLYAIESFVNIGTVLIQKEMRFGKQFLYDASYVVTEIIATTILAYIMRDVWALVYGALIGRLASVIFSYTFHEYRPRITSDLSGVRDLFTFSKWIWITSIFIFLASKVDTLFIGKFLTIEDLGHYQLALSLALVPATEISRSLATVLFPLFSNIQENKDLLSRVFEYAYQCVGAITIPLAVALFIFSTPIITLLYGVHWIDMIPLLKLLSIYGLLRSFEYVLVAFLNSIGKPRIVSYATIMQSIALTILLYPCISYSGISGVVMALIGTSFVSVTYLFISIQRNVAGVSFLSFLSVGVPVVASLITACIIATVLYMVPTVGVLLLLVMLASAACIYGISFVLIDRAFGGRYFDIIDRATNGRLRMHVARFKKVTLS